MADFTRFLSEMPAGDYALSQLSYDEQIKKTAELLDKADMRLAQSGSDKHASTSIPTLLPPWERGKILRCTYQSYTQSRIFQ